MNVRVIFSLTFVLAALTGPGATPAAAFHDNPFGGCAHAVLKAAERPWREAEGRRRAEEREVEFQRQTAQLRPPAEAGDPEASFRLGWHLFPRPDGVAWLCRAADRGHGQARYIIALHYERGFMRAKDRVHAHLWHDLAAAAGYATATAARDELAAQMSGEELANSRRLAKAWRPGQCEAAIDKPRSGG